MKNNNKDKKETIIYTKIMKVKRSGELLDFLLNSMDQSRNNVKNLLKNHQILVNGVVVTQFNYPIAKEDEIKIAKNPVRNMEAKPKAKKKEFIPRIDIIYEDENYIAIDKPNSLLAVESDKETLSAYSLLSDYMASISKNYRPFTIHRIDKETSGVLVFTKNPKTQSILRLNWNDYVIKREYYAIVEGHMPKKSDTIKSYLKSNEYNLMYSTNDPSGELAITHYEVIKEASEYSLLRVLIDTGRKNQIRCHMKDLGHPIVGDDKYQSTKNPIKRLGLHASFLEFRDPNTNESIKISAKVPAIFNSLFVKK